MLDEVRAAVARRMAAAGCFPDDYSLVVEPPEPYGVTGRWQCAVYAKTPHSTPIAIHATGFDALDAVERLAALVGVDT